MSATAAADLEVEFRDLGPWFHDLNSNGVRTAPDHPLGEFLRELWAGARGVLSRLRHPLSALEKVAGVGERLIFQSMLRGGDQVAELTCDCPIEQREVFFDSRFPAMYFIEASFAGDPTNWWIPNRAGDRGDVAIVRAADRRPHGCEVYAFSPEANGRSAA